MATQTQDITDLVHRLERATFNHVATLNRPHGHVVPACIYREHDTDWQAATIGIYSPDDYLQVCPACAPDAVQDTIVHQAQGRSERVKCEVTLVESPTIDAPWDTPPLAEPVPGMATVVDADGRWIVVQRCGVETTLDVLGREQMRLDLSGPSGVAAARVLRDALAAALSAVGAA